MRSANDRSATTPRDVDLTDRQRQVLRLIAAGKTNAEIGEALGISLDGAKWHVSEILAKLEVATREEAAEWWRQRQRPMARLRRMLAAISSFGWLKVGGAVAGLGAISAAVVLAAVALHNGGTVEAPSLTSTVEGVSRVAVAHSPTPTPTPPDCPEGRSNPRAMIDWVPFLRILGRSYLESGVGATRGVQPGRQVGVVVWNVTDSSTNPCYSRLDGSSSVLAAGTAVYAMKGYREEFRLVAEAPGGWRIFETVGLNGGKMVGDILDIRGKVASILEQPVRGGDPIAPAQNVDQPDRVAALTELILDVPVSLTPGITDPGDANPPELQLTFHLTDGTTTVLTFYVGATEFSQGIPVSPVTMGRLEAWFAGQ